MQNILYSYTICKIFQEKKTTRIAGNKEYIYQAGLLINWPKLIQPRQSQLSRTDYKDECRNLKQRDQCGCGCGGGGGGGGDVQKDIRGQSQQQ